jgi:hypothetical protein
MNLQNDLAIPAIMKKPLKDNLLLQRHNRGNFDAVEGFHSHTSFCRVSPKKVMLK